MRRTGDGEVRVIVGVDLVGLGGGRGRVSWVRLTPLSSGVDSGVTGVIRTHGLNLLFGLECPSKTNLRVWVR